MYQQQRFSRKFSIFLLVNTLFWVFMIFTLIALARENTTLTSMQTLSVWGAYYATSILSSFIGVFVSEKMDRRRLLHLWFLMGIAAPASLLFQGDGFQNLIVIAVSHGVAFGFGIPTALTIFADSTEYENRGFTGGLIFSISNLLAIPLVVVFTAYPLLIDASTLALICLAWRACGWLILALTKPQETLVEETEPRRVSFKSVFQNRLFVLYFIPWFIFSLIERFEEPILTSFFGNEFLIRMGVILGPFSALIGGFLADRIGRKRVVVYGFVSMGLAYAIVGIAGKLPFALLLYVIADGITWGILPVLFILVIWGDISATGHGREKYYVIGSIPWLLAEVMRYVSRPFLTLISAEASFSLAAFFLFIAIIPLIPAPETMPEKTLERRRMEEYIEKAKKYKKKHETKN